MPVSRLFIYNCQWDAIDRDQKTDPFRSPATPTRTDAVRYFGGCSIFFAQLGPLRAVDMVSLAGEMYSKAVSYCSRSLVERNANNEKFASNPF